MRSTAETRGNRSETWRNVKNWSGIIAVKGAAAVAASVPVAATVTGIANLARVFGVEGAPDTFANMNWGDTAVGMYDGGNVPEQAAATVMAAHNVVARAADGFGDALANGTGWLTEQVVPESAEDVIAAGAAAAGHAGVAYAGIEAARRVYQRCA
jgi:hypothetical protein